MEVLSEKIDGSPIVQETLGLVGGSEKIPPVVAERQAGLREVGGLVRLQIE
jgi:hypothetical protein